MAIFRGRNSNSSEQEPTFDSSGVSGRAERLNESTEHLAEMGRQVNARLLGLAEQEDDPEKKRRYKDVADKFQEVFDTQINPNGSTEDSDGESSEAHKAWQELPQGVRAWVYEEWRNGLHEVLSVIDAQASRAQNDPEERDKLYYLAHVLSQTDSNTAPNTRLRSDLREIDTAARDLASNSYIPFEKYTQNFRRRTTHFLDTDTSSEDIRGWRMVHEQERTAAVAELNESLGIETSESIVEVEDGRAIFTIGGNRWGNLVKGTRAQQYEAWYARAGNERVNSAVVPPELIAEDGTVPEINKPKHSMQYEKQWVLDNRTKKPVQVQTAMITLKSVRLNNEPGVAVRRQEDLLVEDVIWNNSIRSLKDAMLVERSLEAAIIEDTQERDPSKVKVRFPVRVGRRRQVKEITLEDYLRIRSVTKNVKADFIKAGYKEEDVVLDEEEAAVSSVEQLRREDIKRMGIDMEGAFDGVLSSELEIPDEDVGALLHTRKGMSEMYKDLEEHFGNELYYDEEAKKRLEMRKLLGLEAADMEAGSEAWKTRAEELKRQVRLEYAYKASVLMEYGKFVLDQVAVLEASGDYKKIVDLLQNLERDMDIEWRTHFFADTQGDDIDLVRERMQNTHMPYAYNSDSKDRAIFSRLEQAEDIIGHSENTVLIARIAETLNTDNELSDDDRAAFYTFLQYAKWSQLDSRNQLRPPTHREKAIRRGYLLAKSGIYPGELRNRDTEGLSLVGRALLPDQDLRAIESADGAYELNTYEQEQLARYLARSTAQEKAERLAQVQVLINRLVELDTKSRVGRLRARYVIAKHMRKYSEEVVALKNAYDIRSEQMQSQLLAELEVPVEEGSVALERQDLPEPDSLEDILGAFSIDPKSFDDWTPEEEQQVLNDDIGKQAEQLLNPAGEEQEDELPGFTDSAFERVTDEQASDFFERKVLELDEEGFEKFGERLRQVLTQSDVGLSAERLDLRIQYLNYPQVRGWIIADISDAGLRDEILINLFGNEYVQAVTGNESGEGPYEATDIAGDAEEEQMAWLRG